VTQGVTESGWNDESGLPRWVRITLIVVACALVAILMWLIFGQPSNSLPGPEGTDRLEPVLSISGPGKGDLPFLNRPLAVAWGPKGDVFVSDTGNGRVCVFSARGRFIREMGRPQATSTAAERRQALRQPAGLAVAEDGSVYVADLRGGVVRHFDRKGTLIGSLRAPLKPTVPKWMPVDVALFGGKVYVADSQGVAVFDAKGKVVRRFDRSASTGSFRRPAAVSVRGDGALLVSDTNAARVVAIGPKGQPYWAIPSTDATSSRVFGLPRGLAIADNDSVMVVDAFRFGLTHLSSTGEVLETYGSEGMKPGQFNYPNDVAIRGDLLVVADKENDRVQVLRLRSLLTDGLD